MGSPDDFDDIFRAITIYIMIEEKAIEVNSELAKVTDAPLKRKTSLKGVKLSDVPQAVKDAL